MSVMDLLRHTKQTCNEVKITWNQLELRGSPDAILQFALRAYDIMYESQFSVSPVDTNTVEIHIDKPIKEENNDPV